MKSRLFMSLFALPFAAVGVFMLYLVSTTLFDAYRMSGWVPVQATLESAGYDTRTGDDSATYEVYATYRYDYELQSFTGNRVTISSGGDNIGAYQQTLGRTLRGQHERGEPVTVYVNPDNPGESIVDRSVRWGLVAFKSVFVLVFGGVGFGLLVATWRGSTANDADDGRYADTPWLRNDAWQTAEILSASRASMWAAWVFAIFWNAVSAPLPFVAYEEVAEKGNYLALAALLFPLVGAGLLLWAIRQTLEWRRFGRTPVSLDPFPGSIGGHVGGSIELPVPYSGSSIFQMTLTSIHSYISGSGKNRSRREKALWQDELVAHAEPSSRGTRLTFRFDLPEGLEESDAAPANRSYKLWRLNLRAELPGTDIDRDYEIPVYRTAETSRRISDRSIASSRVVSASANDQAVRDIVRVSFDGLGKRLDYPMGRNLLGNSVGFLVGLTFALVGGWVAHTEGEILFGVLFGGIGALFAILAFYMMFKSLEVTRVGNTIRSVRRLLGIPIGRREMQTTQILRLEKDSGLQTQSGGKHTIYYRIKAIDRDSNEMLLGEGFRGESGARAGEQFLIRELGIA